MCVKILSLYDGMACGMIAMLLAGVPVESYDAYEIDKYAIKTAQHNFPMIKEHGDVFDADFTQYEGVDFLIGGSPCTYWSIAQTKNRETVASGMGWELFSQYVRALHEAKPKYFIYENNKSMSKQIRASIDDAFGFEAICINSALVSAQNRQRLYWVGKRNENGTYSKVNVEQPADRGILLKDVLDNAVAMREKAHAVIASAGRTTEREFFVKNQGNMVAELINSTSNGKAKTISASYAYKGDGEGSLKSELFPDNPIKQTSNYVAEPINITADGKSQTLKAQYTKNNVDNFCCYSSTYGASGVAEPVCVAERGRMYCGQPQHYEARTDGKTNTLTSVEKDNRVAEPVKVGYVGNGGQGNRVYSVNGKAVAQTAQSGGMGSNTGLYAEPINVTADGKAQCLRATCYKDGIRNIIANEVDKKTGVAEPINDILQVGAMPRPDGEISTSAGFRIYSTEAKGRYLCANGGGAGAKTGLYAIPTMPVKEATARGYTEIECGECVDLSMPNSKTRRGRSMADKANCMQTSNDFYQYVAYAIEFDDDGRPIKAIGKDGKEITIYEVKDGKITIKGKQYPIKLKDGYYIIRKLTVSECKRLQTVPEWYEFPVSNSQAYKMLGNGWTCEVICHLINSCLKPVDALPGQIGLWG